MTSDTEIKGLYSIIPLSPLRKTPNVTFDAVPLGLVARVDAIDRVLHGAGAHSPGEVGNTKRPWYMHPHQIDHLVVMQGLRVVDLYSIEHGRIETFEVTPTEIRSNGKRLYSGAAILSWPTGVFHRVVSGDEGSASINLASHLEGLDMNTNFNIYSLDTETGAVQTIRAGHLDQ